MSTFNDFKKMINNLNADKLSELCEQFLTDHESAMTILSNYCSNFGLKYDDTEIKEHMSKMVTLMMLCVLELNFQKINYIKSFILHENIIFDYFQLLLI